MYRGNSSGCLAVILVIVLFIVAGVQIIRVWFGELLLAAFEWLFYGLYFVTIIGSVMLIVFLAKYFKGTNGEKFLASFMGLILLIYTVFAAPIYHFLFVYSRQFTLLQELLGTGGNMTTVDNRIVYAYAGLIAFVVFLICTVILIVIQKRNAAVKFIIYTAMCFVLIAAVIMPVNRVTAYRNPILYYEITSAESALHYVITNETNLYWSVGEVRLRRRFGAATWPRTTALHFPNVPLIPRFPVQTLPEGTQFVTRNRKLDGLLEIAIDERTVGYVRVEDTSHGEVLPYTD